MANSGQAASCIALAVVLLAACPGPRAARRADEAMRAGLEALYQRHDPEAAARSFRHVLAVDPQNYGASFQLACALRQAGRRAEAEQAWATVARLAAAHADPDTADAARRDLAESASARAEASMREGLAALYGRSDPAVAERSFREVLAADPAHYGANFQLATALDRMGRTAEARPYWEKVLALASSFRDRATIDAARKRLGR
ncbi:MAG TPA: tetratricopeptide repeat protein [Thermoanaerobaculaceae bacterium]|nr:tetratricopeptide repeat protein [Thermoanaerobaculaceae bacterium]